MSRIWVSGYSLVGEEEVKREGRSEVGPSGRIWLGEILDLSLTIILYFWANFLYGKQHVADCSGKMFKEPSLLVFDTA